MGQPVGFQRKTEGELVLGGRKEAFAAELNLSKEVDPESGMTLNLSEVDELLAQMWQRLQGKTLADPRELLSASSYWLRNELQLQGAELVSLTWKPALSQEGFTWLHEEPESAWQLKHYPTRIELGDQLRVGETQVRNRMGSSGAQAPVSAGVAAASSEGQVISVIETLFLRETHDGQILGKLRDLFPEAFEICFRDLKTGENWRWEK